MPPKNQKSTEEMKTQKTPRKKDDAAASPTTKNKDKPADGAAKDRKKSKKSESAIVVADKGGGGGGGGLTDDVKLGGKVDAAAAKKKKSQQQDTAEKRKQVKSALTAVRKKGRKGPISRALARMGIGLHDIIIRNHYALEVVGQLELQQKHLHRLKRRFEDIDLDGSGTMDTTEYLEAVGEQRSPFTDRMFSQLDLDPNGVLDFDDFVRVTATYCMFTKDDIMKFCFECFDTDGSGTIDEKEFVELCKVINNANPVFPKNFKSALETFDVNDDGLIDYAEFIEMEKRFPIIMFPAFRLQDILQKTTLGEREWLRVMENVHQTQKIEDYKATHGGKMPPDTAVVMILKVIVPCFFRSKKRNNLATAKPAGGGEPADEGKEKKKRKKPKDEEA